MIWKSLSGLGNTIEEKCIMTLNLKNFICLDVGFHYGWWSALLLKNIGKKGKVYAWEPNSVLFQKYCKKWPFKNFKGYDYALSNQKGTKKFYITEIEGRGSELNSLRKKLNSKNKTKLIELVKTDTLDNWWIKNNKENINFIKIDAEGHDYKILLGGKKMIKEIKPEFIWIEENSKNVSSFMKKNSYKKIYKFNRKGLKDSVWEKIL